MSNEEEISTILVVDDDDGIRDLLAKFLRQHNFNTVLAKKWRRNGSSIE